MSICVYLRFISLSRMLPGFSAFPDPPTAAAITVLKI